jgi:aspartyl aminopeptidase
MEEIKALKERLFRPSINGYQEVEDKDKIFDFSNDYINFISKNKTERECTKSIKDILETNNFKNIENIDNLKAGDKCYYINRNKNVYAAVIGTTDLEKGFNIIGAHIDSPRLDLKPNPLYEDTELAMFKTHYYGGIKKYQWVNIPLSMHGVIVKANGEKIEVNIGEKDDDPIFTIADLLPHLAKEQEKKTLEEAISGEDLNILVGSIPYTKEKIDNNVKLNILNLLNQKYGLTERDFVSSEIEFVPAMKAHSLGLDQSLIAGYGQDDRSCAYTSLRALINIANPQKTAICLFADKEEIGSVGNTGMCSKTFEYFVDKILEKTVGNKVGSIDKVFNNSKVLSADVTGAYNPNYPATYEKNNESYLGHGISILKYTGSASKGGASDANAEFVGHIRSIFEENNIVYQNSEMGKIGVGGGGTISYILANRGADVLDCGIPVISMHSPYEITSKFDIYNAYKAYEAFFKDE